MRRGVADGGRRVLPVDGSVRGIPRRRWEDLPDADLLQIRIKDLSLSLEETEIPSLVAGLHRELGARGLTIRPPAFLADEWFCPDGEVAIGVPFYLAHPRLRALEFRMMFTVEGGTRSWCRRLLRHEAGHAIDHAFGLSDQRNWTSVFGSKAVPYAPESYTPDPRSRDHVVNLPDHYAQAHPEEDHAETFAVWLDPRSQWRLRYRGWPAMKKLHHVDRTMQALAGRPAPETPPRLWAEARTLRSTLASYYRQKLRLYHMDDVSFTLPDLRTIFDGRSKYASSAATFIRKHRREIVTSIARWSGDRRAPAVRLVGELAQIAERDGLRVGPDTTAALIRFSTFVAALEVKRLHTLTYRRSNR